MLRNACALNKNDRQLLDILCHRLAYITIAYQVIGILLCCIVATLDAIIRIGPED